MWLLGPCLLPFQRFVFAYNDNWTIGVIGWGRRETFLLIPCAFLKTKNGLVVQVLCSVHSLALSISLIVASEDILIHSLTDLLSLSLSLSLLSVVKYDTRYHLIQRIPFSKWENVSISLPNYFSDSISWNQLTVNKFLINRQWATGRTKVTRSFTATHAQCDQSRRNFATLANV